MKFLEQLKRSNVKIKTDRAERIARSAAQASLKMIFDQQQVVSNLIDSVEDMVDISADNRTTTSNVVVNFKAEEFANKMHTHSINYQLEQEKLDIMVTTHETWFGEIEGVEVVGTKAKK